MSEFRRIYLRIQVLVGKVMMESETPEFHQNTGEFLGLEKALKIQKVSSR
ncbi:hypothetical protein LEP1GSC051_2052 [Leptospira sp. P2653]|nr:hypothetical protein LEP1GSC051_2052 [Leptospira sp. P2653]